MNSIVGPPLTIDLFVSTIFQKSSSGCALKLDSIIHCDPSTLKKFLQSSQELSLSKGFNSVIKTGDTVDSYNMTYTFSTRHSPRCEVSQRCVWSVPDTPDGSQEQPHFLLVSYDDSHHRGVAHTQPKHVVTNERTNKKVRKRDKLKEAIQNVVQNDPVGVIGMLKVKKISINTVTKLFMSSHGTTRVSMACVINDKQINEGEAKEGTRFERAMAICN